MDLSTALVVFLLCYLIGSISFGRIIARIIRPAARLDQLKAEISGTGQSFRLSGMGASNIGRVVGKKASAVISLLDVLKVAGPVLALKLLYPGTYYPLLASLGGIIGHDWPVYYGFKGGRGMTGTYGSLLVIDWLGTLAAALTGMLLGVFIIRNLMVFYFGSLWLMLPWFWFRNHDPVYVIYALLLNLLFLAALIPDIREVNRLRKEMPGKITNEMTLEFSSFGRAFLKFKRFTTHSPR
jgi:acyl-phosphate glycerol 3-phosphate acyltransferase